MTDKMDRVGIHMANVTDHPQLYLDPKPEFSLSSFMFGILLGGLSGILLGVIFALASVPPGGV